MDHRSCLPSRVGDLGAGLQLGPSICSFPFVNSQTLGHHKFHDHIPDIVRPHLGHRCISFERMLLIPGEHKITTVTHLSHGAPSSLYLDH